MYCLEGSNADRYTTNASCVDGERMEALFLACCHDRLANCLSRHHLDSTMVSQLPR